MPTLYNKQGAIQTTELQHDLKNTTFQGVLFDIHIRLNKTIIAAGGSADYDAYTALVNHLEDLLAPLIDQDYYLKLKRSLDQVRTNLKMSRNYSEAELQDEAVKELAYLEARAKFKACNRLTHTKLNFYPMAELIDEVD